MPIRKKKTLAKKEKDSQNAEAIPEIQEAESQTSSQKEQQQHEMMTRSLAYSGEAIFQILVKWQETNSLLKKIVELEEERNELLSEEELEEEE